MGKAAGLQHRLRITAVAVAAVACSSGVDDLQFKSLSVGGNDASVTGGNGGDASVGGSDGGIGGGGGSTGGGAGTGGITGNGGVPTTGGAGGGAAGDAGTFVLNEVQINASIAPQQELNYITAAAWEPVSQRVFLLEPANQLVWKLDPVSGNVEGSIPIPGANVVSNALAVSADTVFVITQDGLWRLPMNGDAGSSPMVLPQDRDNTYWDKWAIAHAGSYLMLANSQSPLIVLRDGEAAFQPYVDFSIDAGMAGTSYPSSVVTDGQRFAVKIGFRADLHVLQPDFFVPNETPCSNISPDTSPSWPSLKGDTVAWMASNSTTTLSLTFATSLSGICTEDEALTVTDVAVPRAVGVIDDRHALLIEAVTATSPYTLSIGIRERSTNSVVATLERVQVDLLAMTPYFATTDLRRAVLVTGRQPVLLSF